MIVLDTHIWMWWVHSEVHLPETHGGEGLGVSIISCWAVAMVVEYARLIIPWPVTGWLDQALSYPVMRLLQELEDVAIGVEEGRHPAAPVLVFGGTQEVHPLGEQRRMRLVDVIYCQVEHDPIGIARGASHLAMLAQAQPHLSPLEGDEIGAY